MMLRKTALQAPAESGAGGTTTTTAETAGGTVSQEKDVAANGAAANTEGAKAESGSALGPDAKTAEKGGDSKKVESKEGTKGEPDKKEGEKKDADLSALEYPAPEGFDKSTWDKFVPVAKELGIPPEKASKLGEFHGEILKDVGKQQESFWNEQRATWWNELKADKDFGGGNHEESLAHAKRALIRFGGEDLPKQLAKYGMDNLPVLAKAWAAVGRAFAEDSSHVATAGGNPVADRDSKLASFYAPPKK